MRRDPITIAVSVAVLTISVLGACTGTSGRQVEARPEEPRNEVTPTTRPPDCAEVLSPGAQAGQLIMVMVTGPQLATAVLSAGRAGGFALKGRQSSDVGDEVTAAITDAPIAPFVASDEEGGTVQRLGAAIDELPSAETMAEDTPQDAATLFEPYATAMRDLGFNMNFGPVADVGSGSGLGTRSFGDDPAAVSGFATAIIEAQQSAGLISVVKHWPGIGGGSADPHVQLAPVAPIDELRTKDLVPFGAAIAAGVPAVMVAHVEVPGLTAENEPASLSRAAITGELRGRQGFTGLVITDALGMGAIVDTTPQDDAAELAIAAGADIALVSGADVVPLVHERLTEAIASRRLATAQVVESVRRVLKAKGIDGPCPELAAKLATVQQDGTAGSLPSGDGPVDSGINDTGSDSEPDSSGGSGSTSGSGSTGSSSSTSTTGGGDVTTTAVRRLPSTTTTTTTTRDG